jgi:hypothetical protein
LLTAGDGRQIVRCYSQDGESLSDFDVSVLTMPQALRVAMVAALVKRTAPGAGLTSRHSFRKAYLALVAFDRYIAMVDSAPEGPSDLLAEHFDGFHEMRASEGISGAAKETSNLRHLLIRTQGISAALAARLAGGAPPELEGGSVDSYSRDEFKRIASAARAVVRPAAARIRTNRELLGRFREGLLDVSGDLHLRRRLQILDHVDRFGDVPRAPRKSGDLVVDGPSHWVMARGKVKDLIGWLHLTGEELASAAVLLAVMTGQNPEVVFKVPAAHHRADGGAGLGTAIVGLRKPRRQSRAYMDLALSDVPDWISVPEQLDGISARDELHTPFGLYLLLHELTARSRELAGGSRLLVGYLASGAHGRGMRSVIGDSTMVAKIGRDWGLMANQADDDGNPVPLGLRMDRLRLTYIELHQRPVAHTEQTAATTYLARNRGNITEYRKVVAQTLEAEVAKARARGRIATMSATEVERARADIDIAAAELSLEPGVLRRMLAGELDTVVAACTDNTRGVHSPAGQPCRASFLLCLDCECARALPQHLPLQVLVHDRLTMRRDQMDTLRWAERFASPHAQLADLLDQHDAAVVDDARASAGPAEHALADRLLNRELDLR